MANVVQRRGMMAAVAAAAAGLLATSKAQRVEAANGDPVVLGTNNSATANTSILNAGGGGAGALGVQNSNGHAVVAQTTSAGNFVGLYGFSVNSNAIYGLSTDAPSIYGQVTNTAPSNQQAGVLGNAVNGAGIEGTSNNGFGVYGRVASSSAAVFGRNGAAGPGVSGESSTGIGVSAVSSGGFGLSAYSSQNAAVFGQSVNSVGVSGQSNNNIGVTGDGPVYGVRAFSSAGVAVQGQTTSGTAGQFLGAVKIFGNLSATGNLTVEGQKSAAVRDTSGTLRRVYCVEAPDSVFEDYGEAQIVNGIAHVEIDPGFRSITRTDKKYFVYLTPTSDVALFITEQGERGFTVREVRGGTSSGGFYYRVVARRRDIDADRLPEVNPADTQPTVPPGVRNIEEVPGRFVPPVLPSAEPPRGSSSVDAPAAPPERGRR